MTKPQLQNLQQTVAMPTWSSSLTPATVTTSTVNRFYFAFRYRLSCADNTRHSDLLHLNLLFEKGLVKSLIAFHVGQYDIRIRGVTCQPLPLDIMNCQKNTKILRELFPWWVIAVVCICIPTFSIIQCLVGLQISQHTKNTLLYLLHYELNKMSSVTHIDKICTLIVLLVTLLWKKTLSFLNVTR